MNSNKTELLNINFDEFMPVYGKIDYPINTLLFRSYHKDFEVISERPAYFTSDYKKAKGYIRDSNYKFGIFKNKRNLKLYDLRFIKHILLELFEQIESNDPNILKFCQILTISYGLTSCSKQLEIFKSIFGENFKKNIESINSYIKECEKFQKNKEIIFGVHPFEVQGIRIAETLTDSISLAFLKDIFNGQIDGYIAPALKSPFMIEQNGYNLAEIVLFNPKNSNIREISPKKLKQKYLIKNIIFKDTLPEYVTTPYMIKNPIITNKNQYEININHNKVTEGLRKSSTLIGGCFGIKNNDIFDKGGDSYQYINTFVRNTMKSIFGSDYYDKEEKKIIEGKSMTFSEFIEMQPKDSYPVVNYTVKESPWLKPC